MQIEVYKMTADADSVSITLEAVCDSFSSLLWDIECYQCGAFEVYIAANPQNIEIFRTGRIIGRDDDKEYFGIIESVKIDTDAENGDYLTVSGRFLMCLLERRIIYPTYSATSNTPYSDIVRAVISQNCMNDDNRRIPGLSLGEVSGECWEQTTKLQVSYTNLMETSILRIQLLTLMCVQAISGMEKTISTPTSPIIRATEPSTENSMTVEVKVNGETYSGKLNKK